MANDDRIYAVARRLLTMQQEGHELVAVLSAQAGETDALLSRARQIDPAASGATLDVLLSAGEQISVALCALALRRLGADTVALNGTQIGLLTNNRHTDATPLHLTNNRLERELCSGKLVLVTGFQGVNTHGDITTLGRGGSDTTAVALAAFLRAERCIIFTDVDGVYTADPRKDPQAVKLTHLGYDEMLLMAQNGAKVLHERSVELAGKYGVPLEVRSGFSDAEGTRIGA